MNNHSLFGFPFLKVFSLRPTPVKVYELKRHRQIVRTCNQRGVYKICLVTGNSIIRSQNKEIETNGTSLLFCNASTTYHWKFISKKQKGYACILTKDFFNRFDYLKILEQSGLFSTPAIPLFLLNKAQKNFIADIFQMMISEQSTRYVFKKELMFNLVSLIVHEALKMEATKILSVKELHTADIEIVNEWTEKNSLKMVY